MLLAHRPELISVSVSPGILHTWLINEKNCLDGLFDVFSEKRKRPWDPFSIVLHFNPHYVYWSQQSDHLAHYLGLYD